MAKEKTKKNRKNRKNKKTRKHRGGKYIDAGSAGCIFGEPPLKCIGEASRRSNKFVSKLTTQEDVDIGIEKFREIEQLDPTSKYFIIPTESCLVDGDSLLPSDEIDKCIDSDDYDALLFMEGGGKNLEKLKLPNSEYIPFFNSLLNFLEGIDLLHTNGYSHFDIKPTNILTTKNRDNTFTTRLIDFDLVSADNTINPANYQALKNMYIYWPLELKYYMYRLEYPGQEFTPAFIDNTVNRWYTNQRTYGIFLIPGKSYFDNRIIPKYARGKPEIDNLSIIDYATYNLSKVDLFSVAKTLSDIYFNLIGHVLSVDATNNEHWSSLKMQKPVTESINKWHTDVVIKISLPFYNLIKEMIHINPTTRPTMRVVINRYNAILPEITSLFTEENLNNNLVLNTSPLTNYAYESPPPSPPSPSPPPPPPPSPPPRGRTLNRTNHSSRRKRNSRSRNNSYSLRSTKKSSNK